MTDTLQTTKESELLDRVADGLFIAGEWGPAAAWQSAAVPSWSLP